MTLLAFVLPFLLFILYPSRLWNFDGVACAAALELGRPVYFFHSNHLLYAAIGYLFWKPFFPWVFPRALPALQLYTSLLSAAGLVGLFLLIRRALNDASAALLMTLCVSVSAVVWVWSVEAQVYALGFLALSWATYELLRPEHPGKWQRIGILHAAAVLGHIVHVLWVVPAVYMLFQEQRNRWRKPLTHYLVPLSLGTVLPYAAVILHVVRPHEWNDRWMIKWLMGSAALNPTSVFQWHSAGWRGPLEWAGTGFRVLWGAFWPYHVAVPGWAWALTALSIVVVVGLLALSLRRRDAVWTFSVLWLAVYAVFFWTWEPRTECYRMTDVIPLSLLLVLGLERLPTRWLRRATLAFLFVTLYPVNVATRMAPMSNAANNILYQETRALEAATPNDSLYLTAGGTGWIYLLYFTGRSAWDLHAFQRNPARLETEIRRHARSHPIFVQRRALELDTTMAWLQHYRLRPLSADLPWVQIQ